MEAVRRLWRFGSRADSGRKGAGAGFDRRRPDGRYAPCRTVRCSSRSIRPAGGSALCCRPNEGEVFGILTKKITFVLFTTDYETKTSIYESLVLAGLLCRFPVALFLRAACCAGRIGRYRAPSRDGRSLRRGVRSDPVDEDMPVVRRHDAVAQRRFLQRIAATFARPRAESRNGSLRRFRRDPRRAGRSGARSL